jgi:hypothetical protein
VLVGWEREKEGREKEEKREKEKRGRRRGEKFEMNI